MRFLQSKTIISNSLEARLRVYIAKSHGGMVACMVLTLAFRQEMVSLYLDESDFFLPLETRQKIMAGDSSRFGTYTAILHVAAQTVLAEVELDFQQFEECKLNFSRQTKY